MRVIIYSVCTIIVALIFFDFTNRLSECRDLSSAHYERLAQIERDFFLFPREP